MNNEVVQMCTKMIDLINKGERVANINGGYELCEDIACEECPLYKNARINRLDNCMELSESELSDICSSYLRARDDIYLQIKYLSNFEIKELINELIKLL